MVLMRRIVRKHFETGATIILIVAFLVFAFVVLQTLYIRAGNNISAIYSSSILLLANEDREAENVPQFTQNPLLEEAAQRKADDMVKNGYFAHVSPDGKTPWYWFKDVGYEYNYAGENLAVNFTDSEKVHKAWMNSLYHRGNILDTRFTEIGIATAEGRFNGKNTVFVVQMFGNPRATTTVVAQPQLSAGVGSLWNRLLSNPSKVLTTTFATLAAIIILALLTYIGSEWRKHHIRHVMYGLTVLVLLAAGIVLYHFFFATAVAII
jgi:Cysteine-rich secretory protein family